MVQICYQPLSVTRVVFAPEFGLVLNWHFRELHTHTKNFGRSLGFLTFLRCVTSHKLCGNMCHLGLPGFLTFLRVFRVRPPSRCEQFQRSGFSKLPRPHGNNFRFLLYKLPLHTNNSDNFWALQVFRVDPLRKKICELLSPLLLICRVSGHSVFLDCVGKREKIGERLIFHVENLLESQLILQMCDYKTCRVCHHHCVSSQPVHKYFFHFEPFL